MAYARRIRKVLTPPEILVFKKLRTPQKIQDYLDALPINFEDSGETYRSPRRLLGAKEAHCLEGALFAAAVLAYHGQKPLLLDLRTTPRDEDHVVALFRQNGRWGAISKTNHAVLRYRDPVYKDVRELAMSYFHEYVFKDDTKTLREYSRPLDLSKYAPERWVVAPEELFWLAEALDNTRHFPIAPEKNLRLLRKVSKIESRVTDRVEWKPPKKRRYK